MDVLSILSATVLIPILLILLLLIIPFRISLELSKGGMSIEGVYTIAWLGFDLKSGRISSSSPEETMMDQMREEDGDYSGHEAKQKPAQMRLPDPGPLLDAFPALVRVLRYAVQSIKFEKISCRLCFGLDDPVDTAVMSGYLWAIASAVGRHRADIFIEPCFAEARMDGNFRGELKARMLWIFVALLRALAEKRIRRLMREMARGTQA